MESLVFGDPITVETLKRKPEYANKKLTSVDMAEIAFNMKNAGGKKIAALNQVKALKKKLAFQTGLLAATGGDNQGVDTVGMIYNATGKDVTFNTSHDYVGYVLVRYPKTIKNGQWGTFVHTTNPGSSAAIVYCGLKEKNGGELVKRDWVMAWDNPAETDKDKKAYTEVCEPAPFDDQRWDEIKAALSNSGPTWSARYDGCLSSVSIDVNGDGEVDFECTMRVIRG